MEQLVTIGAKPDHDSRPFPRGNDTLFPNPRAYMVRVGQTVTCIYSRERIVVAKIATHGNIYRALPGDRLQFIGSYYEEFEPAFVSDDRLQTQLAQATCQ